jgi:hypothetical protein
MTKLFMPLTLILGGALAGCSNSSVEYTFGDRVRLSIERGPAGISLVELAVGPAPDACRLTKVDVALKGMSPTALRTTRRQVACRV